MTDTEKLTSALNNYFPHLEKDCEAKFIRYFELLVDANTRINLTAVTEPADVAGKHFADSVLPEKLIAQGSDCIDIGTGAGFPGVPLKIMRPDISVTLVDSLNKRVEFLKELCAALQINAQIIHARAEDIGRNPAYRGKYDIALTRAVASASALLEWTCPLLKVGGKSLMYKGERERAMNEISLSANALAVLNMSAEIQTFDASWGARSVIVAAKRSPTTAKYPRKAGTANKNPL